MKVQIKQNLIIFEEPYEWVTVRDQIKQEFGEKIFMISWRAKRELGFTVRHHQGLKAWDHDNEFKEYAGRYYYSPQIHLDFYNEVAMSWFMLKYLNNNG
jgi:hypothetical protein